ncbi:MAG TPA: hypothetical protein VK324_10560 [Tepidisphaeraceae bacterium]|nr:hypothetical protein [Tepidisphaeraceae bacterium]
MSQPTVKWGQLERCLIRRGFTIEGRGGDKVIKAPKDGDRTRSRQQLYIGHTSCGKAGSQVLPVYLSKVKNLFGITIDDILNA